MIETTVLDVYDAACVAGGTDRVVDAAVVALVGAKRVRVDDEGRLTAIDPTRRHPVEGAVLDAIGTRGTRTIGIVQMRAAEDDRIARLVDRLERDGLVSRGRRFRRGAALVATSAGRQAVRRLRADAPAWRSGDAALVALGGRDQLPDADLRAKLFGTDRPVRRRHGLYRGPRLADRRDHLARAALYGGGAGAGWDGGYGSFGGFDGGGGGGCDGGAGSC